MKVFNRAVRLRTVSVHVHFAKRNFEFFNIFHRLHRLFPRLPLIIDTFEACRVQ